jgi:hypothetical protein
VKAKPANAGKTHAANSAMAAVAVVGAIMATWTAAPARAAFENIMIMPEDADPDTIERGHPVSNCVIDALSSDMAERGLRIFDETVTLPFTAERRTRRRDAELIETARLSRSPPIDVIVIFQVRITAMQTARYVRRPNVRISGRILTVRGGRLRAAFDTAMDLREIPDRTCERDSACETNEICEQAAGLARAVGKELTEKLSRLIETAPPQSQEMRSRDNRVPAARRETP